MRSPAAASCAVHGVPKMLCMLRALHLQYYPKDQPRQWVTSGGLGSMGFGLPSGELGLCEGWLSGVRASATVGVVKLFFVPHDFVRVFGSSCAPAAQRTHAACQARVPCLLRWEGKEAWLRTWRGPPMGGLSSSLCLPRRAGRLPQHCPATTHTHVHTHTHTCAPTHNTLLSSTPVRSPGRGGGVRWQGRAAAEDRGGH